MRNVSLPLVGKVETGRLLLWLCYGILAILLVFQAFTHEYVDEHTFMTDAYFVSQGLVPYHDFFEHHPVFFLYLIAPIFSLTGASPAAIIVMRALSIIGVLACAWLVHAIAKRHGLRNPHVASLIFLAGYTGLPVAFVRYDFFAMLFLLLFLYFRGLFLRGFFLTLLASLSPVTFLAAFVVWCYECFNALRTGIGNAAFFIGGSVLASVLWLAVQWKTGFALMYYYVVTFNNLAAPLYAVSWQEVVFFSLFFVLYVVLIGGFLALRRRRTSKDLAVPVLLFAAVFILQILAMNLLAGFGSRLKLPAPIPMMAAFTIFFADIPWRKAVFFIAAQLMLTLFIFTPALSMPILEKVDLSYQLDACVARDASVLYVDGSVWEERGQIMLFRTPAEFYWYGASAAPYLKAANITYAQKPLADKVSVCGVGVSRSDVLCDDAELKDLDNACLSFHTTESIYSRLRRTGCEMTRLCASKV